MVPPATAQADTVTVDGTNGNDAVEVHAERNLRGGDRAFADVVHHREHGRRQRPAGDQRAGRRRPDQRLDRRGRGMRLTIDGGAGNDTILGSHGDDKLLGGDGNDFIDGNQGNDLALMGAGDDLFQWDPGDGSDMVEGQARYRHRCCSTAPTLPRTSTSRPTAVACALTRDVANIVMDLNGVEHIQIRALGGADNIVVGDLTGTDVTEIDIESGGTPRTLGDGLLDQVIGHGYASGVRPSVVAGRRQCESQSADCRRAIVMPAGR